MPEESCLIKNLSYYIKLDKAERAFMAAFEENDRHFQHRTDIYRSGEEVENLYTVTEGWAFSYLAMPDGKRQILNIHVPGDIIGLSDIADKFATHSLRTAGPAVLCPFPKTALTPIFTRAPRLSALLFAMSVRESQLYSDLIRCLGRMNAGRRVAYMLLTILARLRVTLGNQTRAIDLRLTQTEIGDHIGLTNVAVHGALKALNEQNLIRARRSHIEVIEEETLGDMVGFRNRFESIDTSWFPPR